MKSPVEAPKTRARVIIYGAVAHTSSQENTWRQRWTSSIKIMCVTCRDILFWKLGSLDRLDYREYLTATVVNRGDQAIAQSAREKMLRSDSKLDFINVNWGDLDKVVTHEYTKGIDLIVVSGSGYISFDSSGRLAERVRNDLKAFLGVSVPIVLYGVGVNQPLAPLQGDNELHVLDEDEMILRQVLARASFVSVRDRASHALLSKYFDKPIRLTSDPALFLVKGKTSTRQLANGPNPPIIGVNFPFHGPNANARIRRDLPSYIEMLKKLRERTNCRFRYFLHFDAGRIIPTLLASSGIRMDIVSGEPDTLTRGYAGLNLHIGGKLHSCILAASAGVPCIALAYDIKHVGFFELLGLERYCFPAVPFEPDRIVDAALDLLKTELVIREIIQTRRLVLEKEADRFIDDCLLLMRTKKSEGTLCEHYSRRILSVATAGPNAHK